VSYLKSSPKRILPADEQFFNFGWRIPFVASAILVWVGLYVRLKLTETPDFLKVMEKQERVKVPIADVFVRHTRVLVLGTGAAITTYLLFYLMTVFTLSWGTSVLHYETGSLFITGVFLSAGMFCMGLSYGPPGTALAEIFPAAVRYTGASVAFTLAGILGASLTPYLATTLAKSYGLSAVGYYLCVAAVISFAALAAVRPAMRAKYLL
jgi:hypothetical protein